MRGPRLKDKIVFYIVDPTTFDPSRHAAETDESLFEFDHQKRKHPAKFYETRKEAEDVLKHLKTLNPTRRLQINNTNQES